MMMTVVSNSIAPPPAFVGWSSPGSEYSRVMCVRRLVSCAAAAVVVDRCCWIPSLLLARTSVLIRFVRAIVREPWKFVAVMTT